MNTRRLPPHFALQQGRYVIDRVLGQGGMGAVYLAADTRLAGRQVAIKQLAPDPGATPAERAQMARQFQVEAGLLARLSHPNLPGVYDYFVEAGESFLVMEYIAGETMEAILGRRPGGVPEPQVLKWAAQLCDVLTYLHNLIPPVIFRDLKPGNIMVEGQNTVRLIDFGIARIFKPGQHTDTLRLGTTGYAPPEQYGGRGQTDARSDIFSLGATMHHLLTGRDPTQYPPFSFDTAPPRSLNPAISSRTESVIMKAVAHNPAHRFQTAAEMKAALLAAASSPLPPTVRVQPQRRRSLAGVVALLTVAVIVAGIALARPGAPPVIATATSAAPRPAAATSTALPSAATSTPRPAAATSTPLPAANPTRGPAATPPAARDTPPGTEPRHPLGRIAFYSSRDGNEEIYIMEGDGGFQRRLTYHPDSDLYPALSPDGERIAFMSNRDGNWEIYVINSDGSGESRLTFHAGEDRLPVWSPDGSKIAFNSDRSGNLDIYTMNADGSNVVRLTSPSTRDGHATWSPDGRWLAFNSGTDSRATWEIYVMPAAGGAWRRLTENTVIDWSPNWSPVDDRIVHLAWEGGRATIAIVNADGSGRRILFDGLDGIWGANWSPDGQRIVFTASTGGRDEIFVIPASGGAAEQLTFAGGAYPSWSR